MLSSAHTHFHGAVLVLLFVLLIVVSLLPGVFFFLLLGPPLLFLGQAVGAAFTARAYCWKLLLFLHLRQLVHLTVGCCQVTSLETTWSHPQINRSGPGLAINQYCIKQIGKTKKSPLKQDWLRSSTPPPMGSSSTEPRSSTESGLDFLLFSETLCRESF